MFETRSMECYQLRCPICETRQLVQVEVPTLYLACGHGMYLYTETGVTVLGHQIRRLHKGWLWWDAKDMEHMEHVQRILLTKPVLEWHPSPVTLRCVCGGLVEATPPAVAEDAPPNERAAVPHIWAWTCGVCGAEGTITKPGQDAVAWSAVQTDLSVEDALFATRQTRYEAARAESPYVQGPQPCVAPEGGLQIVQAHRARDGRWPE